MAQSASQVSPAKSETGKSPAKVPKQSVKPLSLSSPKNFQDYTIDALVTLDGRKGATRSSLVNYIRKTHTTDLESKKVNNRLKQAIGKLIEQNRVIQVEGEGFESKSRFKLEKKFKEEVKKLKASDDETPKKVTMPKKSSAKKDKPKDAAKQTKKVVTPKKATTKASTPKKATTKAAKESTPKKAAKAVKKK